MNKKPGMVNVSVQLDADLVERLKKVKGYITMAEFIRRSVAVRVNEREKNPRIPEPYR